MLGSQKHTYLKKQKPFQQTKNKKELLNPIKYVQKNKHITIATLSGKMLRVFLFEIRNKIWMSQIIDFRFNFVLEVLTTAVRGEKAIKCVRIEMEEAKLLIFANDMLVYIEHLKV